MRIDLKHWNLVNVKLLVVKTQLHMIIMMLHTINQLKMEELIKLKIFIVNVLNVINHNKQNQKKNLKITKWIGKND